MYNLSFKMVSNLKKQKQTNKKHVSLYKNHKINQIYSIPMSMIAPHVSKFFKIFKISESRVLIFCFTYFQIFQIFRNFRIKRVLILFINFLLTFELQMCSVWKILKEI